MTGSAIFAQADLAKKIGDYIVAGLAVAGAGAVGFFATMLVIWLIGKIAFNKQPPKQITRVLSVVGGVALAVLVAGLLMSGSGGGLGGGGLFGWFGKGKGTGEGKPGSERTDPVSPGASPRTNTESPGSEAGSAPPLQILMLGGERVKGDTEKDKTFYQVQLEGKALNLDELKALIRDRKNARPPLREIVIIIRAESVAHNHPAVKRLEEFAKDERLAISYQKPDGGE